MHGKNPRYDLNELISQQELAAKNFDALIPGSKELHRGAYPVTDYCLDERFSAPGLTDTNEWKVLAAHVKTLFDAANFNYSQDSYEAAGGRKAQVLQNYMLKIAEQWRNNEPLDFKAMNELLYLGRGNKLQSVAQHRSTSCFWKISECKTKTKLGAFNELVQNHMRHQTGRPTRVY